MGVVYTTHVYAMNDVYGTRKMRPKCIADDSDFHLFSLDSYAVLAVIFFFHRSVLPVFFFIFFYLCVHYWPRLALSNRT